MKEKLQEYALLAEIISGLAIVVTLVILIFEVKGNTTAVQISNRQSISARGQEMATLLIENQDLRVVLQKMNSGNELSDLDESLFGAWMNAHHRIAEESYNLYEEGQIEEEDWNIRTKLILNVLETEFAREVYRSRRDDGFFGLAYTNWLDQALIKEYGEK